MRLEVSHHDAARVLEHGGGVIYTQSGIAYKVDQESCDNVLLTATKDSDWCLSGSDILAVFSNNAHLYVDGPPLPPLPRGYIWGGDNPLVPDRVEEVLPENFGTREESFSRFTKSTYCKVATNQTQRDICAAVVALYDQQHQKP